MQIFIVSNRDRTYYFANNNARHFAFNSCKVVIIGGLSAGETELSLVS